MLQAFMMVLREGFESFLIVAIIISYLRKIGQKRLFPAVYLGIVISVIVSAGLGLLLLRGINQSFWEGVLGFITILMVGTLVIHMWRTGPRLRLDIHRHLRLAASKGSASLAFLAVFFFTLLMITREGMETALMLLQIRDGRIMGGILLGLAASVGMALLWARHGHLINLRRFFQVTGLFLLLFMVQVGIYSLHEFSESGVFPHSEAFHLATEPFSPVGIYGQWFPLGMVLVSAVWLLGAWVLDRFQKPQIKILS